MKKLPYPAYLALFLGILGIISAGLLAGINILTAPAIKANEEKKLAEQLKVIEVESPKILEVELLENVQNAYEGLYSGKEVYVFNVQNKNQYLTIQTLVVITKEDGKILNISVGLPATNPPGIGDLGVKFGLIDATQEDYDSKFVKVTNNLSNSVKAWSTVDHQSNKEA